MPYIQLDGQQIALVVGETTVGAGTSAKIRVEGAGDLAAVIRVGADRQTVIRRAGDAVVRVNGLQLGAEPTPLIHGDKIEVGGRELTYGDDRKAGSTQYITPSTLPEPLRPQARTPAKPTAATGGRLISLVDGREYSIGGGGLVIGRDATCDVVVSSSDVSRRHASISSTPEGYVVTDTSTNGVVVNGQRVKTSQTLGRGDVIKIGGEEFRFHADAAPPEQPKAAKKEAVPVGGTPTEPMPHPALSSSAGSSKPVLATLEVVNAGILRGQKFEIRSVLVHVGRGAHNDIVLPDESVSDSHAKLQRREAGWYVVDMGSTNGTYVAGRRVDGEQSMAGTSDVRFGGIKLSFQPGGVMAPVDSKGTRAIAARPLPSAATPKVPGPAIAPGAEHPDEPARPRAIPLWFWISIGVLMAIAAAFIYRVSQGR